MEKFNNNNEENEITHQEYGLGDIAARRLVHGIISKGEDRDYIDEVVSEIKSYAKTYGLEQGKRHIKAILMNLSDFETNLNGTDQFDFINTMRDYGLYVKDDVEESEQADEILKEVTKCKKIITSIILT